jgi:plasmid stabilization system protein ParE
LVFHVEISASALQDAETHIRYVVNDNADERGAVRWWNGLLDAVDSLEIQPFRCARVPERALRIYNLRHLFYHSHRIVFRIDEHLNRVRIVRIYHSARRPLRQADVR